MSWDWQRYVMTATQPRVRVPVIFGGLSWIAGVALMCLATPGFVASGYAETPVLDATVPGAARFQNYDSPPGSGDDSGEPSIGSNWTTEQSFSNSHGAIPNGGTTTYFGGFSPYMLRITFNDCQSPAIATWEEKSLLTASTPRVFGDPILFTDRVTGRTFVSQEEGLTPLGSTTDFTDDDGDTFLPTQGSGVPSCVDHQTIGGGPFHAPLTGIGYPHAVYYASQCVGDAVCSLSLDGGVTFLPSVPMYTVADCAGLHGHIKVGPDGTVYIPNKGCGGTLPFHDGGQAAVVVSEDNGVTWDVRPIPGSVGMIDDDPSVGVATNGNIYLGWQSSDGHPRIAKSTDKGLTWGPLRDVGTSLGIVNCVFPEVVAGDGDRAAFAFYGTTTAGAYDQPDFPGVWYLYIATTYDGGNTWTTVNATPGDPIQRGGVCDDGDCRNMLDFFDITVDKEGRILVGWDDGCIGGCVTGGGNSFSAKAVITRQSGGKRLFAAYDPVEPGVPQAAGLTAGIVGPVVHLAWTAPDNGGATITEYRVYHSSTGDAGPFSVVGTVNETAFDHVVNPANQNRYRVTAVNSMGEGPYCQTVAPNSGPVANACIVPGLRSVSDVNSDGSDNDSGQNTPVDPAVNIRALSVSEPYLGPGVAQLTFTLQVEPTTGSIPSSSQWYIVWNRATVAADGSDRRFVAMKSNASGALSFVYGDFGPPLPLDGSLPALNANTPTVLGNADSGTYDPATGLITIKLAANKADAPVALGAGDDLAGLNVRTFLLKPDGGPRSQNIASDITGDGNYVLVGNASCFVNSAPIASLDATPTEGHAPLIVTFDASGSSDPDPGDGVAMYTFNFGDGSSPVTQSSATINHTYNSASGPSGFFATLTVEDQAGKGSVNVASIHIQVTPAISGVNPVVLPTRFNLAPMTNPAQDQMFLTLDVKEPGPVTVQVFSATGRLVANLLQSPMSAGTHSLHWRAIDSSGAPVPAGMYMVRARTGEEVTTARVVLVH
ncbi:MAG TPA: PKD domain-containing protein [Candidatus Eisenbacteria bacterium]